MGQQLQRDTNMFGLDGPFTVCGYQEDWMNGNCLVSGSPVSSPGLGTILWRQLGLGVVTVIEHLLVPWLSSWRCSSYKKIKSQLYRVVSMIKSCFTMSWAHVFWIRSGSGMKKIFRAHGWKRDRRIDVCICTSFLCVQEWIYINWLMVAILKYMYSYIANLVF